jgi:polygalacturonase
MGNSTHKPTNMKTTYQQILTTHWLKTIVIAAAMAASNHAALSAPTLPSIPSGTYNITSYGASTGSANNATAIQNAINAASAAGGGTVVVPSGTFLSGPITLKSKVCLNLASGSTLKMLAYGTWPGNTAFIDFGGQNNVKISGSGTIDGQGAAWWSAYNANNAIARPGVLNGNNCTVVQVTGIKLVNAPNVFVSFHYVCDQITVDHITITAPSTSPNTDGVDLEGSNFLFDSDNIACGDDNIAIVGSHVRSQYIVIQNCTFGVGHGCSIGSYTGNGVDHLTVNNCTFSGTTSGVRIKSGRGRGGVVQYLTYSNITMNKVAYPIWLSEYYPSDPSNPTTVASAAVTSTTPNYKHILIQNLTATGATSARTVYGLPEQHVSDVVFDNVKITATTGMNIFYANGIVFKNGSSVTVSSGNAVTIYQATVTGITTHNY